MVQNGYEARPAFGGAVTSFAGREDDARIVASLDRLFSLCALYPADHIRIVEARNEFQQDLAEVIGKSGTLLIEGGREGLFVHSQVLGVEYQGVRRFQELLQSIGINRIEILPSATAEDLHRLASLLLKYKHQAEASQGFRQFEFPDLPSTIRIAQREFGKRHGRAPGNTLGSERIEAAIESTLRILEERDIGEEKLETCQRIIEEVLAKIVERVELESPSPGASGMCFDRSLDDVLELGVHAIQHAMTELLSDDEKIDDLRNLFESAEKAVALSNDRESVELLIDVLQQASRECLEEEERSAPEGDDGDESGFELSLEELQKSLADCAASAAPFNSLRLEDLGEHLSNLAQLLFQYPTPKVLTGIGNELSRSLSGKLLPRERRVLLSACRQLLNQPDKALVDRSLPLILKPLRQSNPEYLVRFLFHLDKSSSPGGHENIWPHLVNEILLGLEVEEGKYVRKIHRLTADLPEQIMFQEIPRLERLDAMREGLFSKSIFHPPVKELYPIFAVLLSSAQSAMIGSFLLNGFQTHPMVWTGSEALGFLTEYDPGHRAFFVRLLREAGEAHKSRILQHLAGKIIIEGLPSLPEKRREETWVPNAIHALGVLEIREAVPCLKEILDARKFFMLPLWPAACRRSAREALLVLDPPPDGEAEV